MHQYFQHERGTYIGVYAFLLGGSNFFAPIIAGFIADAQGWQWVLVRGPHHLRFHLLTNKSVLVRHILRNWLHLPVLLHGRNQLQPSENLRR